MSKILWGINLFEINSPAFNNLPNPLSLKLQKKSRIDYKIFKSELGPELKHIDLSFQPISHPNQHKIYKSPKVPKNRILGAQELINGNTQQELADRWSAQTLSTPFNINPFVTDDRTDPRGRRGSVERHENFQLKSPNGVSFLGGILSETIDSSATRTIVGRPGIVYFAPFANIFPDNTTVDSSPGADFPGGYAFTEQHLSDLLARGLNPRDPSSVLGQEEGSLPTLLDLARFLADNFITEQFVKIDGNDVTPANIQEYRQETDNLNYFELPRSTGVLSTGEDFNNPVIVADPDLGKNLDNKDPFDDKFPTLAEINPSLKEFVVPFVQAGDYFGVKLGSGAHTLQFGDTGFGQDVTYNILNPIEGKNRKDILIGTRENDYIDGKSGRDTLLGFWGDDLLVGGKGEDWLDGGFGKDELWGDEGKDTFIFKQGYGEDTIFDLESGEIVKLNWFSDYIKEDITLPGGASTQITFNDHDILTIVGIQPDDVVVNLREKTITLSSAVMVEPL